MVQPVLGQTRSTCDIPGKPLAIHPAGSSMQPTWCCSTWTPQAWIPANFLAISPWTRFLPNTWSPLSNSYSTLAMLSERRVGLNWCIFKEPSIAASAAQTLHKNLYNIQSSSKFSMGIKYMHIKHTYGQIYKQQY